MNIENFITEQHQAVQSGQTMMIVFPLILLVIVGAMIFVAVKTVKSGKLPHSLEVIQNVRQPIRNHNHFHYSGRMNRIHPLSEEEANQYDAISLNE